MINLSSDDEKRLAYLFGHLVSSYDLHAHSADAADLARDEMNEMGLDEKAQAIIESLAEHVHGNYEWTGEAEELERRIERGEV